MQDAGSIANTCAAHATTVAQKAQELIVPLQATLSDTWTRMDVPSYHVYAGAVKACTHDLIKTTKSTGSVLKLTLKPIIVLLWILAQAMGRVLGVLSQHLLARGFDSAKKGWKQAKIGAIAAYKFQMSLTRTEVLGEIGFVVTIIALYFFRKWLRRQTYVTRLMKWGRQKRQKAAKSYKAAVYRIARVSLFVAMLIPHVAFFGAYIGMRLLVPSFLSWLAKETYLTAIISLWYPLLWTIGWVSGQREVTMTEGEANASTNDNSATGELSVMEQVKRFKQEKEAQKAYIAKKKTDADALPSSDSKAAKATPSYMRTTAAQKSREKSVKKSVASPMRTPKRSQRSAVPPPPSAFATPFSRLQRQKSQLRQSPTDYWLRYWVVYASAQIASFLFFSTPFVGIVINRVPRITSWAAEAQLLFYIWVFAMDWVIAKVSAAAEPSPATAEQDPIMIQSSPLHMLHQNIFPLIVQAHTATSQIFSPESWEQSIVARARRVLELLVMVRLLSESTKDFLLHVLTEARTLLLPSITLLMPGFITQFGVAYVQYIVPCAKSLQVKSKKALVDKNKMDDIDPTKETKLLYLKYWVLHCIWAGFLAWFASILWWIPLSTHLTYLSWCYMTFPRTVNHYYEMIQDELVAFSLIEPQSVEKSIDINDTRTLWLFQKVVSMLPKANDADGNVVVNLAAERFMEGVSKDKGDEKSVEAVPKNRSPDDKTKEAEVLPPEEQVGAAGEQLASPAKATPLADKTNRKASDLDSGDATDKKTWPETDEEDEDFTIITPPTVDENTSTGLRRSTRRRKPAQRL